MRKILASILVCLSLFTLTACGGDKLKGSWSGASNDGLKAIFTFDGSGKVTYKNDYFEGEGTYTIAENKVTIEKVWDDKKVYEFTIKDNKLDLKATDKYSPSYSGLDKK